MYSVELYGRVRRAVFVEGKSQRAVAQEFGVARRLIASRKAGLSAAVSDTALIVLNPIEGSFAQYGHCWRILT